MLAFIAAALFLLITPGPGVLTVAGVGAAYGFRAGLPYMIGVVLGSLIVMAAVVTGIAAFVFSWPPLRIVLLVASAAYLIYIAMRIATAGAKIAIIAADRPLGFFNGIAMQFINPKAYAVMTTMFSGFPVLPQSPVLEPVIKAAVFAAISFPVHTIWLLAGAGLKRLALSPRATRIVNVAMALAMLAVVALAAWSQIRPA